MTETFYDVLGVPSDATQAEITDAYRDRVKETHPDLNDSEDASEQFQRVSEAEEVLGDPDERARYDRLGHASYQRTFGDPGDPGAADTGDDGRDSGADDAASSATDDHGWAEDLFGNRNHRRRYPGSDSEATGDGNETRRSYYVGGPDSSSGSSSGPGPTSSASTSAGGGASSGGGASGSWWASGSVGYARRAAWGRREHVSADEDRDWTGYSVHDWDQEELRQDPVRVGLSRHSLGIVGLTFVLYPLLAYMSVSPVANLLVNVVVAGCTLLLLGFLLTVPRVSMVGFGTLSVLVPLWLLFVGTNLLSPMSLFLVGACVVPFGYSVLFSRVVD
ncbi:J domain-containing protein [Haloarchaeobius sp. HRN-SO-5]|uniref:J domain-containing protein n=1 Tax=Haloarchaeobius sp. HRN-SO-5 TaxID=3446118 RepID=UPI003EB6EEF2